MDLYLAKPRGFCAGVDRAVDIVELCLRLYGPPVYVRHEIVHNRRVVEDLRAQGAVFVDEPSEVPPESVLVFSAHGVSPAVRATASARNLRTIDATCPLVTKVHIEALRYARAGYTIVLIGHKRHVEVEGTMGEAPESIVLVSTIEEARRIEVRDPGRVAYITQTTLSMDDTREVVAALRRRFPSIREPSKEDICYATQNRQNAVKALAERCEVILVVGAPASSNANRLVEVAIARGLPAHLIETAEDIRPEWLAGVERVGLTAGASAPEILVREVVDTLADRYGARLNEIELVDERVSFPLPRELATMTR